MERELILLISQPASLKRTPKKMSILRLYPQFCYISFSRVIFNNTFFNLRNNRKNNYLQGPRNKAPASLSCLPAPSRSRPLWTEPENILETCRTDMLKDKQTKKRKEKSTQNNCFIYKSECKT